MIESDNFSVNPQKCAPHFVRLVSNSVSLQLLLVVFKRGAQKAGISMHDEKNVQRRLLLALRNLRPLKRFYCID